MKYPTKAPNTQMVERFSATTDGEKVMKARRWSRA